MADLSIIEYLSYGLIGYTGVIILMISVLLNPPTSKSLAGARSIWLMPSVICLSVLMFASGTITLETNSSSFSTTSNATSEVWTETGTQTISYTLVDPVWALIHMSMFLILIIYIIVQVLQILTKPE